MMRSQRLIHMVKTIGMAFSVMIKETIHLRPVATFTSNRLTFWQNGAEAVWVSNGQWCCRSLTVQERIDAVGWRIDFTNGLASKWMGE